MEVDSRVSVSGSNLGDVSLGSMKQLNLLDVDTITMKYFTGGPFCFINTDPPKYKRMLLSTYSEFARIVCRTVSVGKRKKKIFCDLPSSLMLILSPENKALMAYTEFYRMCIRSNVTLTSNFSSTVNLQPF